MTITAKIIANSVSLEGIELTTMQLRYPKFIHGEFLTHRQFSRNASSSRAIPVERMIEDIQRDPAMPVFWGKNQSGMQAREELSPILCAEARSLWRLSMMNAIAEAKHMHNLGAHKQIVNRLLEPFMHINVVVTGTANAYNNFYALRRHQDAQPEIQALANAMWDAQNSSVPTLRVLNEWHLPYVNDEEIKMLNISASIKISVARCARVSYLTHDGRSPNIEEDLKLYERLVGSTPLHASPAEHQATPDEVYSYNVFSKKIVSWLNQNQHGNFRGWRQYRKMLPNECVS